MNSSASINSVEESISSLSDPSVVQDALREINQLIDDLEVAAQSSKEELERELTKVREESELLLLQLHQVQEELEYYFLESLRKDHLLGQHALLQRRLMALHGRFALPSPRRQLVPWWRRLQRSWHLPLGR